MPVTPGKPSVDRERVPDSVRVKLYRVSGECCAMCHRSLVLEDGPDRRLVAEAAHIVAAMPGGPRGGGIRPSDVNSVANLILLCPTDHRMIDKEPIGPRLWPVDKLLQLKAEHEAWMAFLGRRPEPRPAVVSAEPTSPGPADVVVIDGMPYRLSDVRPGDRGVVEGAFSEQRGAGAVRLAAHAYAERGRVGHVWLRRVAGNGPDGRRWRAELATEAALLIDELPDLPALPRLVGMTADPTVTVLVSALPSVRTLGEEVAFQGRSDTMTRVLLDGMPDLCTALGELHDIGRAHGVLNANAILVGEGRLSLRDLGRATDRPSDRAEDVRALAGVVYTLLTGAEPTSDAPYATALNPAVPERAAEALRRVLSTHPRAWGDIRRLGRELRAPRRPKQRNHGR